MKSFKFIIDGLNNCGKTKFIKKLFKEYKKSNISFYNETHLINFNYKDIKKLYKFYKQEYNIIETSIFSLLLSSQFMSNFGYIKNMKKIYKFLIKIKPLAMEYFHILLINNEENKEVERIKDNRLLWFNLQEELDKYLTDNLESLYKQNNINYMIVNINNEEQVLELEKLIRKLNI